MDEPFDRVPPSIARYEVPRVLLDETVLALRARSAGWREAVALWQGRVLSASTAAVTKLIVPKQSAGPLHFDVPLDERFRILREVSAAAEFILIQLHTHPREAFHSPADDRLAVIKHVGAVSIVVPDFARGWSGNFGECSVNMSLGGGRWREMERTEADSLLRVE